jgi:rubrerythrin
MLRMIQVGMHINIHFKTIIMSKDDLKYDENSYGGIQANIKKPKKVKYQCNACGHISNSHTMCPKCNGGMFKYINRIGK